MTVTVAGRPIHLDPRAVATGIRREIASLPRPLKVWLGFLGALVVLSIPADLISVPPGWEVFGTSPSFEWGILIAAYVFFVVTTSGLCLVSSLGQVFGIAAFKPVARRAVVLAIMCLMSGFMVIALDLHYPLRLIFGVVLSPSPLSAMWWMGTLYGIYLVFLLVELSGMFFHVERIAKLGSVLALVTAIAAPSTLGAVFGVLVSRPYWHGGLTPIYMLLTALVSGAALLGVVFYLVNRFRLTGHGPEADEALRAIGALLAVVLGMTMVFTAWQLLVDLYGGTPGSSEAAVALLAGPLSLRFWLFRVAIGLVVPLLILVRPRTRTAGGIYLASSLAFIGMFAERMGFVSGGEIVPSTAASGVVSYGSTAYAPSLVEALVVIGALALVGFFYTLAERYLDLREPVEHRDTDRAIGPRRLAEGAA